MFGRHSSIFSQNEARKYTFKTTKQQYSPCDPRYLPFLVRYSAFTRHSRSSTVSTLSLPLSYHASCLGKQCGLETRRHVTCAVPTSSVPRLSVVCPLGEAGLSSILLSSSLFVRWLLLLRRGRTTSYEIQNLGESAPFAPALVQVHGIDRQTTLARTRTT